MVFYHPNVMREPIGGDENQENLGKSLGGGTLPPVDFICCELAFKFRDLESADLCDMELKDLIWPNTGSKANKTPHNNI